MLCGEVLLVLRTFVDSLPPEILPLTSLKFLSVLDDVGRAPFASAGHEQGREKVEYHADDILGEGLCRVSVREFQDKQGACSECSLVLSFRSYAWHAYVTQRPEIVSVLKVFEESESPIEGQIVDQIARI